MHNSRESGRSIVKILVIVLSLLILLSSTATVVYFQIRQNLINEAANSSLRIAESIDNGDAEIGFSSFSDELKGDEPDSIYISWFIWVGSFAEVEISKEHKSIEVNNNSPASIIGGNISATIVYETSGDGDLSLSMQKIRGKWFLTNYSVVERR